MRETRSRWGSGSVQERSARQSIHNNDVTDTRCIKRRVAVEQPRAAHMGRGAGTHVTMGEGGIPPQPSGLSPPLCQHLT